MMQGANVNKYYNMVRMYNILESDTNDIGSTIHFDKRNFDCFGIRIYHLLFMSCNLFELVAKEMAEETVKDMVKKKVEDKGMGEAHARKETPNNMNVWKVVPTIRQFSSGEITFLPTGYKFNPLKALGEADINKRNLTWWQDYNSVKHDLTQIHNATLRNLIHALCSAGLLVSHIVVIGGVRATHKRSVLFGGLYLPSL